MRSVAVAIINYNTVEHLRTCLRSVRVANAGEVLVKDNGSDDGSVEMVTREFPEVVVHPSRSNPGYGAASNEAIAACSAPCVLLLNSDTVLAADTLVVLSDHLDAHPRAAIVGPRLHNSDGTLQPSAKAFPRLVTVRPVLRHIPWLRDRSLLTWQHDRARVVPWVKGAALAIRRAAFDEMGGFDPAFFMYFEETDLCYRLRMAGWEIHFTPATTIVHAGEASTSQLRPEMAAMFHDSMRHFYRKHYSSARLARLETMLMAIERFPWLRDRAGLGS